MKKKIVIIISLFVFIVLICVLSFIAMKPAMQINMAFNLEKNQFYYDFAVAFLDATEGMRGMTRYEQIEYISKNDFENHIQNMQGIIDRRILALRKWEKELGMVYSDPFHEMGALVALEHAYHLFRAGFDKNDETDNEEWRKS